MGRSIIDIVEADFLEHGPEVIAALREKNPAAYARLVSDLVHFKGVLHSERVSPKRKPRPLRMKELLKAMDGKPVDVGNPRLSKQHRERWLEAEKALLPRTPWELSPEELRNRWPADLAGWFERHWRAR
jgi:hypothetical protein